MYPGLSDPRIVVVQAEASPGVLLPWIPVGVTLWEDNGPRLTICVKMTFSWKGASPAAPDGRSSPDSPSPLPVEVTAALAASQEPLSSDRPHPLSGAGAGDLWYATDFVPRKAGADVLLVGHAKSRMPTTRIPGSLSVGEVRRAFTAAAGGPAAAIPLTEAYVETDDRAPLGPSAASSPGQGPSAAPSPGEGQSADSDAVRWNAARGAGRTAALPEEKTLVLHGLSAAGPRAIRLPDIVPTVTADSASQAAEPVDLTCDTLWVDADRDIAVLVFRGSIALVGVPAFPDRIVLSIDPTGRAREPAERDSALMRGRFGFAVRAPSSVADRHAPADVADGAEAPPNTHEAANDEEAERLEAARMETWAADAPAPVLSLERYALVSAALVEHPNSRGQVLASHDLDETSFTVEERAWAERMANEALNGDGRLAERYAVLFVERQDELGTPEERAVTLVDYAKLRAALEVSDDTSLALSERGVTLASYLRLERRWEAAAKADPALARELSARVETFKEELLANTPRDAAALQDTGAPDALSGHEESESATGAEGAE